jgi:hypothetical protein
LFFKWPSTQTNENLLIFAPASASKTNGVRCLEAVLRINDKIDELLKIRRKIMLIKYFAYIYNLILFFF